MSPGRRPPTRLVKLPLREVSVPVGCSTVQVSSANLALSSCISGEGSERIDRAQVDRRMSLHCGSDEPGLQQKVRSKGNSGM